MAVIAFQERLLKCGTFNKSVHLQLQFQQQIQTSYLTHHTK